MDNTLHTDCLQLRPITKQDAKAVFAYRSDAVTNQYQSFIPKNIDEVYDFIENCEPELDEEGTWFQLVIIHTESDQVIGDLGIHTLDDAQVELGVTIAKEYHGKGYAYEAMMNVMDFLFTQQKKHRIIASIDPRNKASKSLIERLGFRKEAHFVESFFQDGEWLDDVQYGILNNEWDQ